MSQLRPFGIARKIAGFDTARAALALGCSPTHLRAKEAGRSPLSEDMARRMAALYGCSLREIVSPLRAGGDGEAGGGSGDSTPCPGRDDFRPRRRDDPEWLPDATGNGGVETVDERDIDGFEPWERDLEDVQ